MTTREAQQPLRLLRIRPDVFAQYLAPLTDVRLRPAEDDARDRSRSG
jgi:hypothetical protein